MANKQHEGFVGVQEPVLHQLEGNEQDLHAHDDVDGEEGRERERRKKFIKTFI